MTEKTKVYCKDCQFFPLNYAMGISLNPCKHPANTEEILENSWFSPTTHSSYERKPSEINANNDCVWFRERE